MLNTYFARIIITRSRKNRKCDRLRQSVWEGRVEEVRGRLGVGLSMAVEVLESLGFI